MLVIPAIDLRDGKCVRLLQGRLEDETVFSDDPVAMALRWQSEGAELLHLVDLDGAFEGTPKNLAVIEKIVEAIDIPAQLGGGIRDMERLEQILALGVWRAILGTAALKNPALVKEVCFKYDERIAVGIDAKDGMVATEGWLDISAKPAIEFAQEMESLGVKTIIYTDIKQDGMLTGPNLKSIKAIAESVDVDIIAAGGISSLTDIQALKSLESVGVVGAITGKALYTGKINLRRAILLVK
ncbi:TPA: 1-(5-phosphoribosyl)-5-[(5-phosphoribosylamino)methylideneamino]imidazole-4-carboxamide isomerase [Candidatus Poribacteria bacterium]|nr:1-(5-phosphoribosyl)-5-[(5-phosphoribosylamino)methylideneamino]imidazole-4-carboxamide isomerase [Candidatus Poribacteria bacterium]